MSIDMQINPETKWFLKKPDAVIVNKTIRDGIKKNPNVVITNLTDMELIENKVSFLKYGLKHGY